MSSPPPDQTENEGQETNDVIAGSPSDFLKNIVGKKVKVRIGSGVDYHGQSLTPNAELPSLPHIMPSPTFTPTELSLMSIHSPPLFLLRSGAFVRCYDPYHPVITSQDQEWTSDE